MINSLTAREDSWSGDVMTIISNGPLLIIVEVAVFFLALPYTTYTG